MKVLFIKNIIPPYRIFLFNKLEAIAKSKQFDFEVFVMRTTEKGRSWKLDRGKLKFKHKIDRGVYAFILRKYHLHINLHLIKIVLGKKFDHLILGGSWNNFNVIIIVLLKRLGLVKASLSFWTEANFLTRGAQNDSRVKYGFRKWILDTCNKYYLIPGKMPKVTLFENWGIKPLQTIYFPNLIDDSFFKFDDSEYKERNKNFKKILLIVARLVEPLKGVLNFMKQLPTDQEYELRIAGDGVDKFLYEKYIIDNDLEDRVTLLGNLSEEQLLVEYKKANVFVLPSYSDPSPLSLVEACYLKLPLLISDRCGNHFEILEEGVNGYLMNPYDPESIKSGLKQLLNTPNVDLQKMGLESFRIVKRNYTPEIVLKDFVDKFNN